MTHGNDQRRRLHATGFIVLDLLVADDVVTPVVGGTAANVAINMSLLGAESAVTALLGDDDAGHLIRKQLEAFGVNTAGVVNDPGVETPVLIHQVGPKGHKFRFSCPACGAKYAKFRPLPSTMASASPKADIHFFDRASAYALAVATRNKGTAAIVFEPGTPGRPNATSGMASAADILRAADGMELRALSEPCSDQIQIIGLGAQGVQYRSVGESEWVHQPSRIEGDLVDAGGAGDWLTAGTLSSLDPHQIAEHDVLAEALQHAVAVGLDLAAACCRHLGTRGVVGTSEWTDLSESLGFEAKPVDMGRFPEPAKPSTTCQSWFHRSNI